MITQLLMALIVIAIICVIVGAFLRLVPTPAPVSIIAWAVVVVIALLLLLNVLMGHGLDLAL